ncbi:helix-turn-helix domain-containing protein [bacterium]|nr:helix-turn-helix domain-containing protein [bacterium]
MTIEHTTGSGNVYKDLGFESPEKWQHKAQIASKIYDIIEERNLTQKEAAEILGISQPKISALKHGHFDGFSIDRLFRFLDSLEMEVEIRVYPKSNLRRVHV